jgi:hypothetical protein
MPQGPLQHVLQWGVNQCRGVIRRGLHRQFAAAATLELPQRPPQDVATIN